MAALYEYQTPETLAEYEPAALDMFAADGTFDGKPVGVSIKTYGDDCVVVNAAIPGLIAALTGYLVSRGLLPAPAGWVVLTNNVKDGPPKWEPDWDGEVHTDKVRADAELTACAAAGHQCVLAEVRLAGYAVSRGLPVPLLVAVDEQTKALWRTSQNDRMVIRLAGEIQEAASALRTAAGLPEIL